jgi:hypothetical protein
MKQPDRVPIDRPSSKLRVCTKISSLIVGEILSLEIKSHLDPDREGSNRYLLLYQSLRLLRGEQCAPDWMILSSCRVSPPVVLRACPASACLRDRSLFCFCYRNSRRKLN